MKGPSHSDTLRHSTQPLRYIFDQTLVTGSWLCFNDYEKLVPSVLSLLTSQMEMVHKALLTQQKQYFAPE